MLVPLLLALLAAPAGPPTADPGAAIVVTGRSLRDTGKALEECLARRCPPDQDIEATLAHAENLFVAGSYAEAWHATHAAIGRNGDKGKAYPVAVSNLYRADGRIALHLGEREAYTSSTLAMKRALAAGLLKNDARLLAADMEVAAMYTSVRDLDSASHTYKEIERRAHAAGREDIAGAARVRHAWLLDLAGLSWLARQELKRIADDTRQDEAGRASARALLASLDRDQRKPGAEAPAAAPDRIADAGPPVLLYQPRLELPEVPIIQAGSTLRLMPTENFDGRWIDVGFRVTPDGQVADLQILRSGGPTDWSPALIRAIGGRRYSRTTNPEGTYRVERYTYTSFWTDVTGSRMRGRSPNARIEYLDLTAEPPKRGG